MTGQARRALGRGAEPGARERPPRPAQHRALRRVPAQGPAPAAPLPRVPAQGPARPRSANSPLRGAHCGPAAPALRCCGVTPSLRQALPPVAAAPPRPRRGQRLPAQGPQPPRRLNGGAGPPAPPPVSASAPASSPQPPPGTAKRGWGAAGPRPQLGGAGRRRGRAALRGELLTKPPAPTAGARGGGLRLIRPANPGTRPPNR